MLHKSAVLLSSEMKPIHAAFSQHIQRTLDQTSRIYITCTLRQYQSHTSDCYLRILLSYTSIYSHTVKSKEKQDHKTHQFQLQLSLH
jgi:hypothetical protein